MQGLKRNKKLIASTLSFFMLSGSFLWWLLHTRTTQPVNWIGQQGDSWLTPSPRSSGWRELPVLHHPSSKEASKLISALQSKSFVVLETKVQQKIMALRGVVDVSNVDFKKPRIIRVFQNGESLWLIGNATNRTTYIAQRRPIVVATALTPKKIFVTLFPDEAPTKSR